MIRRDELGFEYETDDFDPFAGVCHTFDEWEAAQQRKAYERARARQAAGLAPDPKGDKPSANMLRR